MVGVEEMALWTRHKIEAVRRLMVETVDRLRTVAPEIYSRELVEAIFTQAYCRIGHLVQAGVGQRQTASVYLRRLAVLGIVREVDAGREKLYVHEAFARLLFTDHAEAASVVREEQSASAPVAMPRAAERVLRAADMPQQGKPHEISGLSGFRQILGSDRRVGSVRWITLREDSAPVAIEGRFTWYDARARSAGRTGRSEWRLYCEQAFPAAHPGDVLVLTTDQAGEVVGFIVSPSGSWLPSLRQVLSLPGGSDKNSADAETLTGLLRG